MAVNPQQQELNLDQIFKQLKTQLANKKNEKQTSARDVSKVLSTLRATRSRLEATLASLTEAIQLLEGNTAEYDEESPEGKSDDYRANLIMWPKPADAQMNVNWFGRKKDGSPKLPSGKLAKKLENLESGPGHVGSNVTRVKKK